ncbi:interleukin-6 [Callorhinchus milii]|uniref:interleukin-6 n=1 Tax=Callorhinchus milii TaxID=7868 RepID=UPI001C3FCF0F|nr:interleukin-6 [Callorhinchus milii]
MPSLPSLCQIALVLMLSLGTFLPGAAASPLPDSSEVSVDFSGNAGLSFPSGNENLESLALFIQSIATELHKKQLHDFFSLSDRNMSSLLLLPPMELPQIRKEDKCFQRRFRKEKCFSKIIKGFQEYKKYLKFVNQWINDEKQQVDIMLNSMKLLSDFLPLERKTRRRIPQWDESNQEALNPDMSLQTEWDRQVRVHVILRKFAFFMESTVRAIRFMKSIPGAV